MDSVASRLCHAVSISGSWSEERARTTSNWLSTFKPIDIQIRKKSKPKIPTTKCGRIWEVGRPNTTRRVDISLSKREINQMLLIFLSPSRDWFSLTWWSILSPSIYLYLSLGFVINDAKRCWPQDGKYFIIVKKTKKIDNVFNHKNIKWYSLFPPSIGLSK